MTITVIKPGLQSTIQSGPRSGLRHQGVAANGAADTVSLALANKLVGNDWHAPAIEATLLGPGLRFEDKCAFAITGAPAPATLNGVAIDAHATVLAHAGDELVIGAASAAARMYLAVAGGFVADETLGSASTNLQAAFGGYKGRALRAGDVLEVRGGVAGSMRTPSRFRPPMPSAWALRACAGAEAHLLGESGLQALFDTNWHVDRRADRMGLRLDGPGLAIASDGRMPSAPVFPGTIQCPEDGAPFILSVDAGTVGGYPRVAQIARLDRHLLGQLRPGDHVRLLRREPDEAVEELRAKIEYWRQWLPDAAQLM